MRRFFIDASLAPSMLITGVDAHHINTVLRLGPGDKLILVDKDGQACQAAITKSAPNAIELTYVAAVVENKEPPIEIWLAQGLPKSDKMDYIVQKAVELGVSRIIPLETAHCVVKYDSAKRNARRERWQKIAHEAAKQCGRTIIPEVAEFQPLDKLLANSAQGMTVIMLYEKEARQSLKNILRHQPNSSYLLIVGPEGGFSKEEVEECRRRGAQIVTLGPRILRTETAGLAAISAVMYENGDLGEIPNMEGEVCRE